jgi:uncharacterized protein YjiS (DUF1127 family)
MVDQSAADRGGSARSSTPARRDGLAGIARTLREVFVRSRAPSLDLLNDHMLQDIGLSRADLQALSL